MSQTPSVTLAGVSYLVAPLTVKQLRHVVPAMMRMAPLIKDPSKFTTAIYDDMLQILYSRRG